MEENIAQEGKLDEYRLSEIERKLDNLSKDVEELVSAWKAASWMVSFIKWLGGLATAVTALVFLFRSLR